jgi:hypothetical protein
MIRRNCRSATSAAGGGPALAHLVVLPPLDVAVRGADDLDHRLAGGAAGRRSRAASASRCRPVPRQRAAGVRPGALQLAGQALEALLRACGIGQRRRGSWPGFRAGYAWGAGSKRRGPRPDERRRSACLPNTSLSARRIASPERPLPDPRRRPPPVRPPLTSRSLAVLSGFQAGGFKINSPKALDKHST